MTTTDLTAALALAKKIVAELKGHNCHMVNAPQATLARALLAAHERLADWKQLALDAINSHGHFGWCEQVPEHGPSIAAEGRSRKPCDCRRADLVVRLAAFLAASEPAP